MNKKPRCQDVRVCPCGKIEKNIVIFHCWKCTTRHCQSVLILLHFDCSLDFYNFSLRRTKIHTKKPAFLRPIKSFIYLKYMPRLHLLPSRISKFSGRGPPGPPHKQNPPLRLTPAHAYSARGDIREQGTCWWVNDDVHFTLEWASGCSFTPNEQFSAISLTRTSYIRWIDDDVSFVLDQHV